MSERRIITSVKSYIEYGVDNKKFSYSVSMIEDGMAKFRFSISEENCIWHMFSDFNLEIVKASLVTKENEIPLSIYLSEDNREYLADLKNIAGNIEIIISIKNLSKDESYTLLKNSYMNSLAHIDQLMISERNLLSERGQLLDIKNRYDEILGSRKWKVVRNIELLYEKILGR